MKKLYLTLAWCMACMALSAQNFISIITPKALLDTSITAITIADVQDLLQKASGSAVSLNDNSARVQIKLPAIDAKAAAQLNHWAKDATYPYRNYPEHNYTWKQTINGGNIVLELTATSWQGVSFGLYGLLQEKLGFKFYHPRNTVIPKWSNWPLKENFTWQAEPLFDKKGFHLHTQHPLELTEQLHDPTMPHALEDVKEYINWLTRNGQNYFEFCLLESIDRKKWPAHAKAIVDYTHQRGLLAAVDLSLHMIQQKTFQMYKGSIGKKKQIEKNLEWLSVANWDFINMEFSTAEFIAGNYRKKEGLRQYMIQWLLDSTHTKLMGRQHVVRHENEMGSKKKGFEWDSASTALDRQRGVLSHTVMFYDMTEPHAPVYENENQRHMFKFLLDEMKKRETWYYPESAYWVTFDVSVPMYLLPYLSARLSDIDTCVKYKVPGHITFSSGWEWGYWLFDWSIARWSWQHTTNGVAQKRTPTMYADELTGQNERYAFGRELELQQHYLKDSSLMQWMTAMTVTDEIGIKALNNEFHPRPKTSYKFLEGKADAATLNKIEQQVLPQLKTFGEQATSLGLSIKSKGDSINSEWGDGLAITGMRATHKYYILQYIIARRRAALNHQKCNCDNLLMEAAAVREKAQQLVNNRQGHYRYPVNLIATKRWDHTSYHFGYLYTVSNLHFWNREEQQALKNKYKSSFMSIWNIWRIAGIID